MQYRGLVARASPVRYGGLYGTARGLAGRVAVLWPCGSPCGSLYGFPCGSPYGHRMLSSSRTAGGPFKLYSNSLGSRVLRYLPQSVKTFGSIVLGTALMLVLAPGLILVVAPPAIVGAMFLYRRLKRVQGQLYSQRWQDQASYHTISGRGSTHSRRGARPTTGPGHHADYEIRSRVLDAIIANEQGLGSTLPSPLDQDVAFTMLESLNQDFRSDSRGISTAMQIEQYGLISGGRRVGTVFVVTKDGKTRIEVKPRRKSTVVLQDKPDHEVIDVEAR